MRKKELLGVEGSGIFLLLKGERPLRLLISSHFFVRTFLIFIYG